MASEKKIKQMELLNEVSLHRDQINNIKVVDSKLLTCSRDKTALLSNINETPAQASDFIPLRSFTGNSNIVSSFSVPQDFSYLATSSWDKTVRFFSPEKTTPEFFIPASDAPVSCLAVTSDKKYFITGDCHSCVKIFEVESKKSLVELTNENGPDAGPITDCVIISYDTTSVVFATSGMDGLIKVWVVNFQALRENQEDADAILCTDIQVHEKSVNCLALSPCKRFLASGGDDEKVNFLDISDINEIVKTTELVVEGKISFVVFSEDSSEKIAVCSRNSVKLFEIGENQFELVAEGVFEKELGKKGKELRAKCATFAKGKPEIYVGYNNGQVAVFGC